jgi:hypothetical protein
VTADFPHLSGTTLEPTQPTTQWSPGSFPVVKQPRRGDYHPDVKEKVELYIYSPSKPSRSVPGQTLPLPLNFSYDAVESSEQTASNGEKIGI